MDLNRLIWTKNVKPLDAEPWAYRSIATIYPNLKIFALHWRNLEHKDETHVKELQEGDLMILRQHGKVTHIVQMLNNQVYCDEQAGDEFNIYRLVQVVWMTDDWHNPPHTDEVFGCKIKFPPSGKAIKLENLKAFKEHWSAKELTFQQHVQNVLKNH
ncbi:hypothetical protein ACE1AT_27225 [Pelatocladus sp. BLCC-F211]|uniref:hypothetical protein n=1 Tax=Pelatocladus sp. BLCC-F211 TaxID=3342752 RepID=UPI0035BA9A30